MWRRRRWERGNFSFNFRAECKTMGAILITFCLLQESSKSKELNVYLQLWGLITKRTTLSCLLVSLWIPRNIFQGPRQKKNCSPRAQENNFQPPCLSTIRVHLLMLEGYFSNLFFAYILMPTYAASPIHLNHKITPRSWAIFSLICCYNFIIQQKYNQRHDYISFFPARLLCFCSIL
jgi:hypothetical protein